MKEKADRERIRIALLNILEDEEEARKKAEREKEKTLSIINSLPDGLFLLSQNFKIILVNPQFLKFFNFKKKEIIGLSLKDLLLKREFKNLKELLSKKNKKKIFKKEIELWGKFFQITTIPLKSKETIFLFHDISREKLIEKAKSDFLAMVAHRFKTPLAEFKWTLDMILKEDFGKISQETRRVLEKMYGENEKMISLINELLQFVKLEEGKISLSLSKVDLKAVVEKELKNLKTLAQRRGIIIKTNLEKVPLLLLDKEKIAFSIFNLIENGIIYSYPQGKVVVSLKKKNKEIVFSVKDEGIGIPQKEQKKIFEKFFRASNAQEKESIGSGLGLYLSKKIVDLLKGKIWFISKEGKGSIFYLSFSK